MLNSQKNEILYQIELLDHKNQEIQILIGEYEKKKNEFKLFSEIQENCIGHGSENLFISREEEINRLLEEAYSTKSENEGRKQRKKKSSTKLQDSFDDKILYLKHKKRKLKAFEKSLTEIKEKIVSEQKISFDKLTNQSNLLQLQEKNIKREKKKIAKAYSKLNEEIEKLEAMKNNHNVNNFKEDSGNLKTDSIVKSRKSSSVKREFEKLAEKTTGEGIFSGNSGSFEESLYLNQQLHEYKHKEYETKYLNLESEYKILEEKCNMYSNNECENAALKIKLKESEEFIKELQIKCSKLEKELSE